MLAWSWIHRVQPASLALPAEVGSGERGTGPPARMWLMKMEEVIALGMRQSAGDLLLDPDAIPWVARPSGVWSRPLRSSLGPGAWTGLLRVTGDGSGGLHRHVAPVEAWV